MSSPELHEAIVADASRMTASLGKSTPQARMIAELLTPGLNAGRAQAVDLTSNQGVAL